MVAGAGRIYAAVYQVDFSHLAPTKCHPSSNFKASGAVDVENSVHCGLIGV